MLRKLLLALLCALAAAATVGPISQASASTPDNIINVTAGVSDDLTGNPNNCPSNHDGTESGTDCSLRDAVAKSVQDGAGDEIVLPSGETDLTSQINIIVPVSIVGAAGNNYAEVRQTNRDARVFNIQPQSSGTYEFVNLMIIGGNLMGSNASDCDGAGVEVQGGGSSTSVQFDQDLIVNDNIVAVNGDSCTSAQGGGLYLNGPDAFLFDGTVVQSNSAGAGPEANGTPTDAQGGGLYYDGTSSAGSLTIDGGSSITNNQANGSYGTNGAAGDGDGGGIYVTGSGQVLLGTANGAPAPTDLAADSVYIGENTTGGGQGNSTGGQADGAGLYANSPVTLRGVEITQNTATSGAPGAVALGGGLYIAALSFVEFSTIAQNEAMSTYSGNAGTTAGVYVKGGGGLTVYESTVADNGVESSSADVPIAGGITADGQTNVVSSTVAGNQGSGVANVDAENASVTIVNSIVADPVTGPDCSQNASDPIVDHGGNFADDNSCQFALANHSIAVPGGAHLGALAANGSGGPPTMLPASNSDALGQGSGCASEDERGFSLQSGAPCDSGAVEIRLPTATANPTISPSSITAGGTLTCTGTTFAAGDTTISGYTYKWLEGSTVVGTGSNYSTTTADAGKAITCEEFATSNYGTSQPAVSAAITPSAPGSGSGSGSGSGGSGSGSGGSGSGGSGSGGSGSGGSGSGGSGSGGSGSSGSGSGSSGSGSGSSGSGGTASTKPFPGVTQTGTTVALPVKLTTGLTAKTLSFAWETGASFGATTSVKQIAKDLSIKSSDGKALAFKITRTANGHARIWITLTKATSSLVLRVNVKNLKLTAALKRSLTARHSHTVTGTFRITTSTGKTFTETVKVTVKT